MATDRLNEYERGIIVPLVCDMLRKSCGRPLPSSVIAEGIRSRGFTVTTRCVRRVINHIRCTEIIPCVASSPKGFFVASNEREITECIYTLASLADSIQEVIDALKRQRYVKFNI